MQLSGWKYNFFFLGVEARVGRWWGVRKMYIEWWQLLLSPPTSAYQVHLLGNDAVPTPFALTSTSSRSLPSSFWTRNVNITLHIPYIAYIIFPLYIHVYLPISNTFTRWRSGTLLKRECSHHPYRDFLLPDLRSCLPYSLLSFKITKIQAKDSPRYSLRNYPLLYTIL